MDQNEAQRTAEQLLAQKDELLQQGNANAFRETLPPADQPRFDEAEEDMRQAVTDYVNRLQRAQFATIEAKRPWYEQIAHEFARSGLGEAQSGEDVIVAMRRISENIRDLPDPNG